MCARACTRSESDRAGLISEIFAGRPPRELPPAVQRELAVLGERI